MYWETCAYSKHREKEPVGDLLRKCINTFSSLSVASYIRLSDSLVKEVKCV